MRVLYFDTIAGISGDMTVGALLSLGLPFEYLQEELRRLGVDGFQVRSTSRLINGINAVKFDVDVDDHTHHHHHDHVHRPFRSIRSLLERGSLDDSVRQTALAIFGKLAEAEGKVHDMPPDDVEFHEVGAVDSIVDVVGAAIGFHFFKVERAYVSPLPLGSGIVRSQHGLIPVPGPATAELLRGFTTRVEGEGELVTPTGAAIVAALAMPAATPSMSITAIGYGAGTKTFADRPNLLRLVLGESHAEMEPETVVELQTNIDDYNPELYDYVLERLYEAGARDVWLTPVHMKKNRPGVVLSLLCDHAARDRLAAIILNETSAIGVRHRVVERIVLPREIREVQTAYGAVRVKIAKTPDGSVNLAPEYDDCKRLARECGVPIKLVYQAALAAAQTLSR
ncbi:MAG TPA: nickel pincer cofactor biosynthesis protein LarC [Candidatus Acidoferrales bacterium]|nr:nickel pincer cofactor biosynthesis protein LarC [Candidatus Acidoferrales bacterium]